MGIEFVTCCSPGRLAAVPGAGPGITRAGVWHTLDEGLTYPLEFPKLQKALEGESMSRTYGYARISTQKQSLERQIDNIRERCADAIIVKETYTGTTLDRPAWSRLYRQLQSGDRVIFDEVSRMSRNAEEGYRLYKELYERGITLEFLKESTLNTENFRQTAQVALTGNDIADIYIEATNRALMLLAEKQIQAAFETAQHEVDFLHKRTSEGVRKAQEAGKQVGRAVGAKVVTKKSVEAKKAIRKYSKDFDGVLGDAEVIKLTGISRNTYYRYKLQMRAEEAGS